MTIAIARWVRSPPALLPKSAAVGSRSKAGGTLFGHNMPRLVLIDDYRLEAYLDGNLLFFTHSDVRASLVA